MAEELIFQPHLLPGVLCCPSLPRRSQGSGATKATQHNHRAWEPPLLKPRAPRARAPNNRGHCSEKPVPATGEEPCVPSNNKDPAQPELMDLNNKIHTGAEKLPLRNRSDGVRCWAIKQQPGLSVSKEPLIVWIVPREKTPTGAAARGNP